VGVAVTLRTVEPSPTAVVPATTTWTEFPRLWGVLLDQVWAFLRSDDAPVGLWTSGHNIMLYEDDVPHVEVGVQVTAAFEPHGQVVPSTLPAGPVATATHIGPIADIGDTHRAVCDWALTNGHALTGRRWEIYGDPDPATNAVDVEVYWSLMAP
jgi:effector-binding domain-containing protein